MTSVVCWCYKTAQEMENPIDASYKAVFEALLGNTYGSYMAEIPNTEIFFASLLAEPMKVSKRLRQAKIATESTPRNISSTEVCLSAVRVTRSDSLRSVWCGV